MGKIWLSVLSFIVMALCLANAAMFFANPVTMQTDAYSHERDCPPGRPWPHSQSHPYLPLREWPRREAPEVPQNAIDANEPLVYGLRRTPPHPNPGGLLPQSPGEWHVGILRKHFESNTHSWELLANFYQNEQAAREFCAWKNGPAPEPATSDLQASVSSARGIQ